MHIDQPKSFSISYPVMESPAQNIKQFTLGKLTTTAAAARRRRGTGDSTAWGKEVAQ
jgi:hypothetical protein